MAAALPNVLQQLLLPRRRKKEREKKGKKERGEGGWTERGKQRNFPFLGLPTGKKGGKGKREMRRSCKALLTFWAETREKKKKNKPT